MAKKFKMPDPPEDHFWRITEWKVSLMKLSRSRNPFSRKPFEETIDFYFFDIFEPSESLEKQAMAGARRMLGDFHEKQRRARHLVPIVGDYGRERGGSKS